MAWNPNNVNRLMSQLSSLMAQENGRPGKWENKSKQKQRQQSSDRQTRKNAAGTSWDCPTRGAMPSSTRPVDCLPGQACRLQRPEDCVPHKQIRAATDDPVLTEILENVLETFASGRESRQADQSHRGSRTQVSFERRPGDRLLQDRESSSAQAVAFGTLLTSSAVLDALLAFIGTPEAIAFVERVLQEKRASGARARSPSPAPGMATGPDSSESGVITDLCVCACVCVWVCSKAREEQQNLRAGRRGPQHARRERRAGEDDRSVGEEDAADCMLTTSSAKGCKSVWTLGTTRIT
eukprot:2535038-Amphidinium_carterae.5